MATDYGGKIQVEGLGALNRMLQDIGGKDARKAMAQAHYKAAKIVYDDAHIKVPIGSRPSAKGPKSEHPGRLWQSLRIQAKAHRGSIIMGNKRAPYGAVIHWGYPKRGIRGRPFIWQSMGRNQERVRLTFFNEMDKVLKTYGLYKD